MSGICERGFNSDVQKIRNFGSPVGIIGTPSFRKNWSLKIRNNWSAPELTCAARTCASLNQIDND